MGVMLIHIIGDIHQPLHAAKFISHEFPKGDMGGNKFKVQVPDKNGGWKEENIHKFIDNMVEKIPAIPRV